jgi:hypothetical protein
MNQPIMIPIVPNDKFEPEAFYFNIPCCWCKHRNGYDYQDPCAECGHNGSNQ